MDIQVESAILQVLGDSWLSLSVVSVFWVMSLAICTEVVYSRCMLDEVEVSLRARLMLKSYNHIECIPLEG